MKKIRFFKTKIGHALVCSLLAAFSLLFLDSCSEDILNKEPLDQFSDAAVWRDEALIQAFVANTYRITPLGGFTSSALRIACATDECYARGGGLDAVNAGNITPSDLNALDFWTSSTGQNYWGVITKVNVFLGKIDESPINEDLKNSLTGEMRFLRAYSYFQLATLHGGVPLITKQFTLNDEFNVPRNTYDECMNFVISELDAIANILPLEYPTSQKGKVTRGAVLAAKSRALLYMASPLNNSSNDQAKWQAAADAAKAVIDMGKYSLFNNYKNLFLKANAYNSEVIWSRPFNSTADPESARAERSLYPNSYGGASQACPLHNLIDDYEMLSGLQPEVDPAYNPQNPYINRDPRFYATIFYDGAIFQGTPVETFLPKGKDSAEGTKSPHNSSPTAYNVRKFIDETVINPGSLPGADPQGNSPWIFIRYAEILLNYAEAKYFLGDEATCREYINKIRSRPGINMPPVTEIGAALLARLQNERRIELVFEEQRWFDVRRWKIAPTVLNVPGKRIQIIKNLTTGVKTYTVIDFNARAFYDRNYLVPIPQTEIEKNSLLTQNPGY